MPEFSEKSLQKLWTCHQDLQDLFCEVVRHVDCVIIEGHRNEATQNEYFRAGKSKVDWPNSKHNTAPSMAVDVVPYPMDWSEPRQMYMFVGFVRAIATTMGIKIRCGADWNGDFRVKDQNFHDIPHFELVTED